MLRIILIGLFAVACASAIIFWLIGIYYSLRMAANKTPEAKGKWSSVGLMTFYGPSGLTDSGRWHRRHALLSFAGFLASVAVAGALGLGARALSELGH
jgi:hypothetical protein